MIDYIIYDTIFNIKKMPDVRETGGQYTSQPQKNNNPKPSSTTPSSTNSDNKQVVNVELEREIYAMLDKLENDYWYGNGGSKR